MTLLRRKRLPENVLLLQMNRRANSKIARLFIFQRHKVMLIIGRFIKQTNSTVLENKL
jgi:hypothetical protein